MELKLHAILDHHYGDEGRAALRDLLAAGADVDEVHPDTGEAPIHVAARRRRCEAIEMLLDHGADIDAKNAGGKTAYAHAARRTFDDVTHLLAARGADPSLDSADMFAVAVLTGRMDEAQALLEADPGVVRTGNPDDDRLLADAAGRFPTAPVALLIEAGADLHATGLDSGTPLHQAAWFGQPANARLLVEAGAPLDVFDEVHHSSPVGWAVHGSRYSGGAEDRQELYVEIVRMLLEAGSALEYPAEWTAELSYVDRLRRDATPAVRPLLG